MKALVFASLMLFTFNSYSQSEYLYQKLQVIDEQINRTPNLYEGSKAELTKDSTYYHAVYIESDPNTPEYKRVFYFNRANFKCNYYEVYFSKKDLDNQVFILNYYLTTLISNKEWRDRGNSYKVSLDVFDSFYMLTYKLP